MNRLSNIIKLTIVLALSLLLLVFVGLGEARRTYPRFQIEKMAAQGEYIRNAVESFLLADFPLEQFPGFSVLTQPILDSDKTIYAFYIADSDGKIVFSNVSAAVAREGDRLDLVSQESLASFQPGGFQPEDGRYQVRENESFYQVTYDLANRYETVGHLHAAMPKAVVADIINASFANTKIASGFLLIVFILFLFITSRTWMSESGWSRAGTRLLSIGFAFSFLVIALTVTFALLDLFIGGITARSAALANSLSQRMQAAFEMDLNLEDFRGLDELFAEYKSANPDLNYVVLTSDDQVVISAGEATPGSRWAPPPNHIEYGAPLVGEAGEKMVLRLGVPSQVVYSRLWRSAKNFLALFIASAFITQLFFNLIRSQSNQPQLLPGTLHTRRGYLLALIGPIYFLLIFATVNGLSKSFLPQFLEQLSTGLPLLQISTFTIQATVSTLFTIYFFSYALSLPFAGRFSEKREPRTVLILGGLMALMGLIGLILIEELEQVIPLNGYQILALIMATIGFGEGLFFIAVQSYILRVVAPRQRTKGAAVLVNNVYGGALAGMTIGALLVVDPIVGRKGVFAIGALIVVFILFYIMRTIPSLGGEDFSKLEEEEIEEGVEAVEEKFETLTLTGEVSESFLVQLEEEKRRRGLVPGAEPENQVRDEPAAEKKAPSPLLRMLSDLEFIKTSLLVGVPVKVVWAGLITASLPLVLARLDYPTEDIGQIMMLYIVGVLLISAIIPRIADKMGKTRLILSLGTIGSGISLILIGLIGWNIEGFSGVAYTTTLLLLSGMIILGLSHGFIQAPIITHISNTKTAKEMGRGQATSLYRILERVGNIGGPLLIGALMISTNYNASTISWVGIAILVAGVIFPIGFRRRSETSKSS